MPVQDTRSVSTVLPEQEHSIKLCRVQLRPVRARSAGCVRALGSRLAMLVPCLAGGGAVQVRRSCTMPLARLDAPCAAAAAAPVSPYLLGVCNRTLSPSITAGPPRRLRCQEHCTQQALGSRASHDHEL